MRHFFKKHWPLAGIGLVLTVVALYLMDAGKGAVRNPVSGDVNPEDGLKLQDIHFSQSTPDKAVKWDLDASEVRVSKDQKVISFSHFRLKLESDNKPAVILKGKRGDYDKSSGNMTLYGDLRGRTENGYEIQTDRATFRQKQGDLETDDPVLIIGPFFTVEGRGLYFNVETQTLRILAEAMTTINNEALIL